MAKYAQVYSQFWTGETGRFLRKEPLEARIVFFYLLTNPHINMIGVYYLPIQYIAYDTGLNLEGASRGLLRGEEGDFAAYDPLSEYVWVKNFCIYQISPQLKENDNRVKKVNELYNELPPLPFLGDFYDKYHKLMHLNNRRENIGECGEIILPTETLECENEKGLRPPFEASNSNSNSNSNKKRKNKTKKKSFVADAPVAQAQRCSFSGDILLVFEFWKKTMGHPKAKLDDKRKSLIRKSLKAGYDTKQLCQAITGCSMTPHNMGDNERKERYDGLHVILRDADQIDRFMRNAVPKLSDAEKWAADMNANIFEGEAI